MKTIEIIGYRRANLGKSEAQQLRTEGNLPCVLYGSGGDQIHFYSPMILFRDLVYTNEHTLFTSILRVKNVRPFFRIFTSIR